MTINFKDGNAFSQFLDGNWYLTKGPLFDEMIRMPPLSQNRKFSFFTRLENADQPGDSSTAVSIISNYQEWTYSPWRNGDGPRVEAFMPPNGEIPIQQMLNPTDPARSGAQGWRPFSGFSGYDTKVRQRRRLWAVARDRGCTRNIQARRQSHRRARWAQGGTQ